jgi:hypothetical protein
MNLRWLTLGFGSVGEFEPIKDGVNAVGMGFDGLYAGVSINLNAFRKLLAAAADSY